MIFHHHDCADVVNKQYWLTRIGILDKSFSFSVSKSTHAHCGSTEPSDQRHVNLESDGVTFAMTWSKLIHLSDLSFENRGQESVYCKWKF